MSRHTDVGVFEADVAVLVTSIRGAVRDGLSDYAAQQHAALRAKLDNVTSCPLWGAEPWCDIDCAMCRCCTRLENAAIGDL